jgi:hypothetical protein
VLMLACRPYKCSERLQHTNSRATYDYIINTYLTDQAQQEGTDLFALWLDLGIDRKELKNAEGHYLFGAKVGRKRSFIESDIATYGDMKVLVLSRAYDCSQVIVFQQREEGSFQFAYAFIHEAGYRSHAVLHEPEPGLLVMELRYHNRHGNGVFGVGWSLYRLQANLAKLLLQTDTYGYEVAYTFGYFGGFLCDMKPLKETWPTIDMHFYAELLRPLDPNQSPADTDDIVRWELEADARLTWNEQKAALVPAANPKLSEADICALIDDQVSFIETLINHNHHFLNSNSILSRTIVQKKEWTSYPWGK